MNTLDLGELIAALEFGFNQGQRGDTLEETCERFFTARYNGQLPAIVSDWLSERERKKLQRDESINEAIRKYHVERGCCDGTFTEPCAFWLGKAAEQKAEDNREFWRRDAIAFRDAILIDR